MFIIIIVFSLGSDPSGLLFFLVSFIIIIIIIKKGRQCKAGRERLTPYQSEDPNPTRKTTELKKRKGKQQETKSEPAARPIKRHWPCP